VAPLLAGLVAAGKAAPHKTWKASKSFANAAALGCAADTFSAGGAEGWNLGRRIDIPPNIKNISGCQPVLLQAKSGRSNTTKHHLTPPDSEAK